MKTYTCSAEAMVLQMYAAQQMMKEIVQAQMAQAEREGYDVEWSFTGELILTEKDPNHG